MRAFSLIETMVALALGGVVAATVVATFSGALHEQARSKREWAAFTIAQQYMETIASLPSDAPLLTPNSTGVVPGSAEDRTCGDIPLGQQHFRTDELGNKVNGGQYDVCIKVTAGNPVGALRNIRVVVTTSLGGTDAMLLQTVR